ncbi:MAG: hypothetical protein ACYTDW_03290 [Planctomycetota bacterium]|jgi:hypothetical protein
MYELLIRIETLCLEAQPLMLLGVGVVMTVLGLLLWLGGSYFSSIIIGVLGAVVGAFCGLLVSQWFDLNPLLSMIIGAAALCIAAVIFRNFIIVALAAMVFALAAGTAYSSMVLISPPQRQDTEVSPAQFRSFSQMDPTMRRAYIDEIAEEEAGFFEKLKALLGDALNIMSPHKWKLLLSVLLGGIGGLLLFWLLKRLVLALCYSGVGALLVLVGTESLLMTVDFQMCSALQGHRHILTIIFFFMVGAGTIVQLIAKKPHKSSEDKAGKQK